MTSAFSWQNSVRLWSASFCTPRPNLPVTLKEEWNRWADSILKKKETPSLHYMPGSHGDHILWLNTHPGLIDSRFHTKISLHQKEYNNPYVVSHLCNLYGTHWCRLQCITTWSFWLSIMAVTWLYLPLTLSKLGLRNLGMWTWAVHLKYIRFSQKSVGVPA